MGRPIKRGLDYFPLDVGFFDDDKIAFVSARFQEKGELIAIKLLCKIYKDNGYYYQWGNDEAILFAKRVVGDPSQHTLVNDVVHELVKRGFFDRSIFDSFKILTSKGIQERYRKICSDCKRKFEIEEKIRLIAIENKEKSISSVKSAVSSEETPISSGVKYTKKIKEKKIKEYPPLPPTGGEEETFLNFTKKYPPPNDDVKRNYEGLIRLLETCGVSIEHAKIISLISNYGEIGTYVWEIATEVRDDKLPGGKNNIKLPGEFILSKLRKSNGYIK